MSTGGFEQAEWSPCMSFASLIPSRQSGEAFGWIYDELKTAMQAHQISATSVISGQWKYLYDATF